MRTMYYLFIFTLLIPISLSADENLYKLYQNYQFYEIKGDQSDLNNVISDMKQLDKNLIYVIRQNRIYMMVAPKHMAVFHEKVSKEALKPKLIYSDYSKLIRMETARTQRGNEFWTAYHDVDEIYDYLKNMSMKYPSSTQLIVGGESYEGRQILGLRIRNPIQNDDVKPVMFIESGIHAREWITPATTTYFINQLLTSTNPDIVALRDNFDWHIFPTINPDGYHYSHTVDRMWRKTRSMSPDGCRGADPNRNWDHNWLQHGATSDSCDYQIYAGSKPFSEKETYTLSKYISGIKNLVGYIAFHSNAQCLLLPYSDSVEHFDNYDDLVKIGKTSLEYGYRVNKAKYDGPGTAGEILYKVSGGSMDWVRQALGTPLTYTYELRGYGFFWPPWKIYEQGDEVTQMMLGLVTEAKNLGYF